MRNDTHLRRLDPGRRALIRSLAGIPAALLLVRRSGASFEPRLAMAVGGGGALRQATFDFVLRA